MLRLRRKLLVVAISSILVFSAIWFFTDLRYWGAAVIHVPGDVPSIQRAIKLVRAGGTVKVSSGTYRESLVIDKPVNLMGENMTNTVIDGEGKTETLIDIEASSVRISGFTIRGAERAILYSSGRVQRCVIEGNIIRDNTYGIHFDVSWIRTQECIIRDNIIRNNEFGILVESAPNRVPRCIIANNTFVNNRYVAIDLFNVRNSVIVNNTFIRNDLGIRLRNSLNSTLRWNNLTNNRIGISISPFSREMFKHVDSSNLVDGRPIYWFFGEDGLVVDPKRFPKVGLLVVMNSMNVTVRGIEVGGNEYGMVMVNVSYSLIEGVHASDNDYGIAVIRSNNVTVRGCTTTNNNYGGIYVQNSEGVVIQESCSYRDRWNGIHIDRSVRCVVSHNMIRGLPGKTATTSGIRLSSSRHIFVYNNTVVGGDCGITLENSPNNLICQNTFQNNTYSGILLLESHWNEIQGNNILYNRYAFDLFESTHNTIYHNNVIGNEYAIFPGHYLSPNSWDFGYPTGGNYWDDYEGSDEDGDGIGDTPYIKEGIIRDNYPLMKPWNGTETCGGPP